MLNALMKKAQSAGYRKLILWTASPLTTAIHSYEKLGFRAVESVENRTWSVDGISLDEIKMELTLHNSVI